MTVCAQVVLALISKDSLSCSLVRDQLGYAEVHGIKVSAHELRTVMTVVRCYQCS